MAMQANGGKAGAERKGFHGVVHLLLLLAKGAKDSKKTSGCGASFSSLLQGCCLKISLAQQ
jgi:hypothetical protein